MTKYICQQCGKEYEADGKMHIILVRKDGITMSYDSSKFCCGKCLYRHNALKGKEKREKTMLERYGINYALQSEMFWDKCKNTSLKRFGTEYPSQAEEIKQKKVKSCREKYGVDNPAQSEISKLHTKKHFIEKFNCENPFQNNEVKEKIMKTNLTRYGNTCFSKTEYFKQHLLENKEKINEKIYLTKKQNNSLGKSKQEDEIYIKLCSKFEKVIRQYKSEKYPFACDFYIPDKNLYIEYQGTWMHGKHPFDNKNKNDLQTLNNWRNKANELNFKHKAKTQFTYAIKVWTEQDILKRKTAKDNNLNWIEFFNLKQFNKWFEKI